MGHGGGGRVSDQTTKKEKKKRFWLPAAPGMGRGPGPSGWGRAAPRTTPRRQTPTKT